MQWLKGLLGMKAQQRKTRQRFPLAYRTRRGKRVWLYSEFMTVPFSVDNSWQEISKFPRWAEAVLSERSEDYERPAHDDGFALLVNGKSTNTCAANTATGAPTGTVIPSITRLTTVVGRGERCLSVHWTDRD